MPPRLSLSQQIAQLDTTEPLDFDPEDIQIDGRDPEDEVLEDNADAGRDHYVDVGPSAIRKLQDSVDDPKYSGVKITRKQLLEESQGGFTSGQDDGGGDEDEDEEDYGNTDTDEDEDAVQDEPQSDNDQRSLPPSFPSPPASVPMAAPEPRAPDLATTLRKSREEDRKKGKAVSKQLALYDALLDARIRLQKGVTLANQLPSHSHEIDSRNDASMKEMLKEASLLSDDLFELQELLLTTNESIQLPPRKKQKSFHGVEEIEGLKTMIQESTVDFAMLEHATHAHTLNVLHKWSSKILAISPSLLVSSNRPTFSAKSSQKPKGAVQLIDEVLADLEKLRARTRVMRSSAANGPDDKEGEEKEIFDDTDFYQSLLRDVIASRTDGGPQDWMAEQRSRKKEKKVIDTKASKGRKLRYQVHEKLQNFMVPISVVRGGWHEEQIDELFASLLGKGFESNEPMDNLHVDEVVEEAVKEGFRVFG